MAHGTRVASLDFQFNERNLPKFSARHGPNSNEVVYALTLFYSGGENLSVLFVYDKLYDFTDHNN